MRKAIQMMLMAGRQYQRTTLMRKQMLRIQDGASLKLLTARIPETDS